MKGARVLEFEKLREICGDFQQLGFAKGQQLPNFLANLKLNSFCHILGAVELPLSCAQVVDPDALGWEYWHSGSTDTTDSRYQCWEKRKQCYELVLDSLSVFDSKAGSQQSTGQDDMEAVRSHAYELAFSSDDELFHSTLYDWLITRGLADELLEVYPIRSIPFNHGLRIF